MTRGAAVLALAASLLTPASAGTAWEKPIAPGLSYRMEIDEAAPRVIHALRWTLRSPIVTARSELAGKTVYEDGPTRGRTTVGQMVQESGALGGINGDYFPYTGDPLGLAVRDGVLQSQRWPSRSVFAWGRTTAAVAVAEFEGKVTAEGKEFPLDGVNRECAIHEMILNTPDARFALAKAPTVSAVIRPKADRLPPSGTVEGTVELLVPDNPRIEVRPGTFVLSASGKRTADVTGLRIGETVRITTRSAGFDWTKMSQAIGGGPKLISGGAIAVNWKTEGFQNDHAAKRHPRTAVGVTAAGDVWLVAVDGRQTMSVGATLTEMAEIMRRFGCVEALNLDGGGSTALNLMGLTLNRPSDGQERPVANGILLHASLPTSEQPLKIEVRDGTATVTDASGVPVPNASVLWAATGDAWIDQGGTLRWLKPGKAVIHAAVGRQRISFEVAPPILANP
ncbi:MAG TPA: phosphodiester glycosidase family protein [Fimbriimonas sp.]